MGHPYLLGVNDLSENHESPGNGVVYTLSTGIICSCTVQTWSQQLNTLSQHGKEEGRQGQGEDTGQGQSEAIDPPKPVLYKMGGPFNLFAGEHTYSR